MPEASISSKTVSGKPGASMVPSMVPSCRAGACSACAMHLGTSWNSLAKAPARDERIPRETMAGGHDRLARPAQAMGDNTLERA